MWPEQTDRLERLDQAVAIARAEPPVIVRGDLLTDLVPLLDQVPQGVTPVVLHSAVLAYVDADGRAAFGQSMMRLVAERGVAWISNEGPGVIPGVEVEQSGEFNFVIARNGTPVALAGQHGSSLRWL